jgi:ribose transport system substrate-binding protein
MRRNLSASAPCLLALSLAACGGAEPPRSDGPAPSAGAPAAGGELYVFLPKSLDNPYWDAARKGMETRAKELGVQAEFLGPDTADAAKQVAIFESVVVRKPAGIAVSPNDPNTVAEPIARARAAGIPVIAWDADAPDSKRIAYVGTDNVAAGRTAGEALIKAIGAKGKVAVLTGSLTALNAIQRIQGFEEAVKANPGVRIVATEPTEDSIATGISKAEALLQAHPDLAAFFGVTGSGVPGAAGAVKQAGKCGKVRVVGFDVVPQGIELMKAGCVQALVSQRPYGMTVRALDILRDLHNGKQPGSVSIDTGVEVVLPETLATFLETDH